MNWSASLALPVIMSGMKIFRKKSSLDYARAVARRCERKVVALGEDKILDNEVLLIWLNRLSDFLYLLARFEEGKPLLVKPKES